MKQSHPLKNQPSPQCSADVKPLVRLTKSSLTNTEEAFHKHLQLEYLNTSFLSAKPHHITLMQQQHIHIVLISH